MEHGKGTQRDIRAEQEIKRARGALSCAECRRLKLKCDKKVPCSSCQRRGCASICPNGSLTTGQGTRFVLADTERLHRKMAEMSDRIRVLEEALGTLQAKITSEPHPLLKNDLLSIKTLQEMHVNPDITSKPTKTSSTSTNDYIDAFGTLAIRGDGASTFYGRSAGSESLLLEETDPLQQDLPPSILPHNVQSFSDAFPFTPVNIPANGVQYLVETFLPQWQRAWDLCNLYLDQCPWFFGAVTREQLIDDLFPSVYVNEAANIHSPTYGPHDLALLFIIFAIGALTDQDLPPAPNNAEAEHYYQLARTSLTLDPIVERAPSVTTVQTLSLMSIYQGLALKENSIESTWTLMGLATKLAQSIGLHRDPARWKLEPKEVQKRRALFWELFVTDAWQSLATGRPPSFTLTFVDCELPQDQEQTIDHDGLVQPSFPFWKARFGAECVTAVVEGTLTARSPKYTHILDIDRKIRDLPLPKYAETKLDTSTSALAPVMKHYMPVNYRGYILVYLHRSFFAQALCDHPTDPFRSQYAPSFLAAYEASCSVLGALREQFTVFPDAIARFWPLWTHAFSAAIIIGSVVTRGPRCKVAPAAIAELTAACSLFEKAAPHGGRAVKVLPILRRMHEKAQAAFASVRMNTMPSRTATIHAADRDDVQDELSVFGGRTRLVATKQKAPQSPTHSQGVTPPSYVSSSQSSVEPTPSPPAQHPPAAFENVHPHLVGQLSGFNDRLAAHARSGRGYDYGNMSWQEPQDVRDINAASYTRHPIDPAPPSYPYYDTSQYSQPYVLNAAERHHMSLPDKTSSLQETWSSFMQQLEVPTPPTFQPR